MLLGVSYFELGDPQSAQREFDEALFIDSTLKLDPVVYSTSVVRFFENRRKNLEDQSRQVEQNRKLAAERDEALRALRNTWVVEVEKRDYYVNFIPFGAGQFQNGQRKKGIAFAVSQSALGFTSAALFTYLLTRYRLQSDVPREEADTVRNLQILQVTTGGLTLGLMAWGILDALIYYEPTTTKRLEADKSYLPKDLRDKLEGDKPLKPDITPRPRRKKPPKGSFRILPVPTANGGGFVASWEF
ncbi:MAG: hypothetical protein KJO07_07030 [Deltaproteobacteria bacterium]|nr:hypothetical protein [Deltaproteobacteria bacterium]